MRGEKDIWRGQEDIYLLKNDFGVQSKPKKVHLQRQYIILK